MKRPPKPRFPGSRRIKVTLFKNLHVALKELERVFCNISDGRRSILEHGRPIKQFGNMLPREAAANWLLAVIADHLTTPGRFQFSADPDGADGLIYDTLSETSLVTEHVVTRANKPGDAADAQALILAAVRQKIAKGQAPYARGKTLVVFIFSGAAPGPWWPDRVAVALPRPLHFDAVWVVAFQRLHDDRRRTYALTRLDLRRGHAPVWWVTIAADFTGWTVSEAPPGN